METSYIAVFRNCVEFRHIFPAILPGVRTAGVETATLWHGRQIGEELGKVAARRQTVLSMAIEGLPVELIARIVKESTDKVRQWIDEGAAAAR